MAQQLEADGFETKTISVDRLDSETRTQLQYAYFKSTIYDRRFIVYSKCDLLTEEILGLERESDGKIEHPEQGTQGSKDCSDACCGAMWHASLHAEEYAYEYGESLNVLLDANLTPEDDLFDFTNGLRESYPNAKLIDGNQQKYIDFGFGPAQDYYMGVNDGIMV